MARSPRRDDPDRDPADEDWEYRPPSKRAVSITVALLVAAGVVLIAYFVLELNVEDLGGTAVVVVGAIIMAVLARARLWR